jgi:hypothetical protein
MTAAQENWQPRAGSSIGVGERPLGAVIPEQTRLRSGSGEADLPGGRGKTAVCSQWSVKKPIVFRHLRAVVEYVGRGLGHESGSAEQLAAAT